MAKATREPSPNGARPERVKVPPRIVYADALEIEQEGQVYHPHAGEFIRFMAGMSLSDITMVLELQKLQGVEFTDNNLQEMDDFKARLVEAVEAVAARIHSWDWTNSLGNPYPNPPTPAILASLEFAELMWILTAGMGGAVSDAERLKDSAPSTTR